MDGKSSDMTMNGMRNHRDVYFFKKADAGIFNGRLHQVTEANKTASLKTATRQCVPPGFQMNIQMHY